MVRAKFILAFTVALCGFESAVHADDPAALYIFPAGGQRGTTVEARIGGMSLHDECPLHWFGTGVAAPPTIRRHVPRCSVMTRISLEARTINPPGGVTNPAGSPIPDTGGRLSRHVASPNASGGGLGRFSRNRLPPGSAGARRSV